MPAMMMGACLNAGKLPAVLVSGWCDVCLPTTGEGRWAKIQDDWRTFSHTVKISLQDAADMGCPWPVQRPGGGCQFLGTAATSQVVGEALGDESDTYSVSTPLVRISGRIWACVSARAVVKSRCKKG